MDSQVTSTIVITSQDIVLHTMGVSGTAALEEWCRRGVEGYEGVKMTNMTSAWRDGRAFCALIHRYRPDLVDWEKIDQMDPER